MRIIAGKLRGLKLVEVESDKTRSTTDRVKESLFNVLGQNFYGGNALDLFAGSGALGLEALSRGMEFVSFVDISRDAIDVIKSNVNKSKMAEKSEIIKSDVFIAMKKMAEMEKKYDYIFLDPPYNIPSYEKLLLSICQNALLNEDGVIIIEHSKNVEITTKNFEKTFVKQYGNTTITILKRGNNNEQ